MMLRKYSLLSFLFYIFLLFNLNSFAEESCTADKSFCIETNQYDGGVSFTAKNNSAIDITSTIELKKSENIYSQINFPFTFTVTGNSSLQLGDIKQKNSKLAWRYNYRFYAVAGNVNAFHDNNYTYTLPYKVGTTYKIIQGYNGKYSHKGESAYSIDFSMPQGTNVLACREGVVVDIKNDSNTGGPDKKFGKFANYVVIKHSDKTLGSYLHLLKNSVTVQIGQTIKVGDIIGQSGNTGWSSGPHLHFWVFKAKNGKEKESIPVKFKVNNNSEILLEGKSYTAF